MKGSRFNEMTKSAVADRKTPAGVWRGERLGSSWGLARGGGATGGSRGAAAAPPVSEEPRLDVHGVAGERRVDLPAVRLAVLLGIRA